MAKRLLQAIKDKELDWFDLKGATIKSIEQPEYNRYELTVEINGKEYLWGILYPL